MDGTLARTSRNGGIENRSGWYRRTHSSILPEEIYVYKRCNESVLLRAGHCKDKHPVKSECENGEKVPCMMLETHK